MAANRKTSGLIRITQLCLRKIAEFFRPSLRVKQIGSDMKTSTFGYISLFALGMTLSAFGQSACEAGRNGTPVSVIVTVEPKHGASIPPLSAEDVSVKQGHDRCHVAALDPLQETKLQLLLLIDNSASSNFDSQLGELKQFITSLPENVEVGVSYMQNGLAKVSSSFTANHVAAANALRVAVGWGGADVSPYDSLADAVKKWPSGSERREVIMICSGIEGLGGGLPPENPYVNAGIQAAQKGGIVVYTIYTPHVGREGNALSRVNYWGQNFLAQLSDETGGQLYGYGFVPPVSFNPFLEAIRQAQGHQYRLTFDVHPQAKASLQDVKIAVIEKNANLDAPNRVFVPAD